MHCVQCFVQFTNYMSKTALFFDEKQVKLDVPASLYYHQLILQNDIGVQMSRSFGGGLVEAMGAFSQYGTSKFAFLNWKRNAKAII